MSKTILYPGQYAFICSCGGKYEIMTIKRKMDVENHCWYCNGKGKHIKIMEETLRFSNNWNNKLNCNSFTTLRLRNDKKYYSGAKVDVYLKNIHKGKGTIISVSHFTIDKINEFIARIDTGYSAEECKNIIKEMYKKGTPPVDWRVKELSFCLIVYDKLETKNLFSN